MSKQSDNPADAFKKALAEAKSKEVLNFSEVVADTGGGDAASERRAACHLHSGDRS